MTKPQAKKSRSSPKALQPKARGEASRIEIIQAGIAVFGRLGFEGATTRVIAKEAKVNLGSLQYHFRGKENLYLACADHIASQVEPRLLALSSRVKSTLAPKSAPLEDHLEALTRLWSPVCDLLLGAQGPNQWLMFVNREQLVPGKAFNILYDRVISRLIQMFSLPVGRVLRLPAESEEVLLNTLALLGPIFIFQRAPAVVLKALQWPRLEGEYLERAKSILLRQSLYGLDASGQKRTPTNS